MKFAVWASIFRASSAVTLSELGMSKEVSTMLDTISSTLLDPSTSRAADIGSAMRTIEAKMDISSAAKVVVHKHLAADVQSLVQSVSGGSGNVDGGFAQKFSEESLSKARVALNELIEKAWVELDDKIMECKGFEDMNRENYGQVTRDIARLIEQINDLERIEAEAVEGINTKDIEIKTVLPPADLSTQQFTTAVVMAEALSTEKEAAPTGPVSSLPADKPKIAFHAAMMAIQNFGFFTMYYDIWGATPYTDDCDSTRYATGMMAITCFFVAFLCVGMGLGGATDDFYTFTIMWFLHLIGGSMYTACTVIVPIARFSDEGEDCARSAPVNGDRLYAVYIAHAGLYLFYVGGMLSITYFSFLKRKIQERSLPPIYVIVLALVIFAIPQAVVYTTI